jgi:hypothetical protein
MNTFPRGRWTSRPTYQELERSSQQIFNNCSGEQRNALKLVSSAPVNGSVSGAIAHHQSQSNEANTCSGHSRDGVTAGKDRHKFEVTGSVDGDAEAAQPRTMQHESAGQVTSIPFKASGEADGAPNQRPQNLSHRAQSIGGSKLASLFRRLFRRNRRRHSLARWLSVSGAVQ